MILGAKRRGWFGCNTRRPAVRRDKDCRNAPEITAAAEFKKDFTMTPEEQTRELERLRTENQNLSAQVRRLIKTESELYQKHQAFDFQIKIYRHLSDIGQKFNSTLSAEEIVRLALHFVVYDLNFERSLIFFNDKANPDFFQLRGHEGFYQEGWKGRLENRSWFWSRSPFQHVFTENKYLTSNALREEKEIRAFGEDYGLSEYFAFPLGGSPENPEGILIAGNTADRINYVTRVEQGSDFTIGLSNLTSLAATALNNVRNYRELENERNLLEEKVNARTQELQKAVEGLKQLDLAKSQFFANVSHELRTPLTLSVGPVEEMLKLSDLPPENRRHLQVVHNNHLRLLKLINDFLDFAKLESGQMQVRFVPKKIAKTLSFYVHSLDAAAETRRIELAVDIPDADDLLLYLDPDKFEKIIMNLLSNAFKFTPDGGRIRVELIENPRDVLIRITDSGIGIPADKLEVIFERFSQVDSSDQRRYEGTGIGLAMVKEYIQFHRGTVRVESSLGKGTTFTLQLPKGKEHLDPKQIYEKDEETLDTIRSHNRVEFEVVSRQTASEENLFHATEAPEAPSAPSAPESILEMKQYEEWMRLPARPKVLVVDDNGDMRRHISGLLRDQYEVVTAADGVDGLAAVRALHPDIVLSDIQMPRMSGTDLCQKIKSDKTGLQFTPVVLITAKADIEMKIEGLTFGADDYLVKPFNSQELLSRVRNLVRAYWQERQLYRAHQALRHKEWLINQDLEQAWDFQKYLMLDYPRQPGLELAAVFEPMMKVSGDFYDIVPLPLKAGCRIFLLDVSGHGIQAALRTMVIVNEFRHIQGRCETPSQVLKVLNDRITTLFKNIEVLFVACCLDVRVAGEKILLEHANAGLPKIVCKNPGQNPQWLGEPGPFMGMAPGIEVPTARAELEARGLCALFTDGIVESGNGGGDVFGFHRLEEKIFEPGSRPAQAVREVMESLRLFCGDQTQMDDYTLILFQNCLAGGATARPDETHPAVAAHHENGGGNHGQ